MNIDLRKLLMFGLLTASLLSGCITVPTTANVTVASTTLSYFFREGTGPTVVLQSGLGDGKDVWAAVIDRLPKSMSIFAYDRPGYGDSPKVSEPRDPCSIARELRELTRTIGLKPPYILVGHSLGGLYHYGYARLFPEDVAGMVLLDPTHPNHWAEMKKDAASQAALIEVLRASLFSGVMRREFDAQAECIDELQPGRPLAIPTTLLFSGTFKLAEKGAFEKMTRRLRKEWLTLFTDPQSEEVSNSEHYLQKEAPDKVARAIRQSIQATPAGR